MCKETHDNLNNILASLALFACIIAASICGVIVVSRMDRPEQTTVEVVVKVDSTGVVTKESIDFAEDLKGLIDRQEALLNDHYRYELEQKDNSRDTLSIFGILITVIISIVGFFGYKSFSSIESKAEKKAEDVAKGKVNNMVNKHILDWTNNKFPEIVKKKFEELYNPSIPQTSKSF